MRIIGNWRSFRIVLFMLVFIGVCAGAHAQTQRILVIGDSWAALEWSNRSFQQALINAGLGQFEENGTIAVGGSTADEWANNGTYLANITTQLTNNPTIDIVYMQIGGNDFLGASPSPTTEMELETFWSGVWDDIQAVVDHIQSIRPNAKIIYGNYDYIMDGDASDGHLGVIKLGEEAIARAALDPNLFYLNTLGLAHFELGVPGQFAAGVRPAPGGFPGYVPLAGGDLTVAGDANAWADTIHYNATMYLNLAELAVDQFIAGFLGGTSSIQISGLPVVEVGDRLELNASAPNLTPPFVLQWSKDGTPIGGETGATLVRDPVALGDAGLYTVNVGDGSKGAIDSAGVQVNVFAMGTLPAGGVIGLGALIAMCAVFGATRARSKR